MERLIIISKMLPPCIRLIDLLKRPQNYLWLPLIKSRLLPILFRAVSNFSEGVSFHERQKVNILHGVLRNIRLRHWTQVGQLKKTIKIAVGTIENSFMQSDILYVTYCVSGIIIWWSYLIYDISSVETWILQLQLNHLSYEQNEM